MFHTFALLKLPSVIFLSPLLPVRIRAKNPRHKDIPGAMQTDDCSFDSLFSQFRDQRLQRGIFMLAVLIGKHTVLLAFLVVFRHFSLFFTGPQNIRPWIPE